MKRWIIRSFFIGLLLLLVVVAITPGRPKVRPPDLDTRNVLAGLKRRICDYVATNHRFPNGLSDLPQLNNFSDGWGRQIQYTREGRTVTLLSLGADGRPGGSNQDADITIVFTVPEEPTTSGAIPP